MGLAKLKIRTPTAAVSDLTLMIPAEKLAVLTDTANTTIRDLLATALPTPK